MAKIAALNHRKKYRYNFQGAGYRNVIEAYRHRKKWVTRFARKHFDARDLLRWTDLEEGHRYNSTGVFDITGKKLRGGYIVRYANDSGAVFDDFYFESLANSEFTLAPGGDGPCTLRFYEAIQLVLYHSCQRKTLLERDATPHIRTFRTLMQLMLICSVTRSRWCKKIMTCSSNTKPSCRAIMCQMG